MGGMGFRDLKNFNEALLAKQAWRLATDDKSLLHRVLKAKYFPHSSFLEAFRGNNSSYTWRSIWGAKCLLLEGLKWRIGNGKSVRVWVDNWVDYDGFIARPATDIEFDPDQQVHDLIDVPSMEWNPEVIHQLFSNPVADRILSMPLSIRAPEDSLFWWPDKRGLFSVKSAYWLGKLGVVETKLRAHILQDTQWWKLLWGLDVPPKLKHFLWCASHGWLATKTELKRRHVVDDAICPLCRGAEETIDHVLFDCPQVKLTWETRHFSQVC